MKLKEKLSQHQLSDQYHESLNLNVWLIILFFFVLGIIRFIFKLYSSAALCDFQYTPVCTSAAGKPQCILENILPTGVDHFNSLL